MAAIGTDTGGSIRVPSALCGLAGYRSSQPLARERGLWLGGVHLAPSFDTLGWIFRDLRDGPLLGEGLFALHAPAAAKTRVRIACVDPEFLHDCEPRVLAVLAHWQERLRERGAEIVPFDAGFWNEAVDIFAPIQAHEAAAIHSPKTGGDFSHFEASIAERLAWGASIPADEMERLRRLHAAFRDRMDALVREYDFLICPCAPMSCLAAGADHSHTRRAILRYTVPVSLAGMPAMTLPSETGAGVQLVAARGADAELVTYAAALSRGLP